MNGNTALTLGGLALCVLGGVISVVSLATAHWSVIDNHANVNVTGSAVDLRVDLVQAYGLFVLCIDMEMDMVGVSFSECSVRNYDTPLSKNLGIYIDVVRGLVICGLILCGVVGCVAIGASITACNKQQNKNVLIVAGVMVALAGILTVVGVIVYGTLAFNELKDTFEDAVALNMPTGPVSGIDVQNLMKSLFNHDLMKLSWSFYLCVAAGGIMLLASVVLFVGSCYSSRDTPPGQMTPGVMYTASAPATVIQTPPFYYGHPQPSYSQPQPSYGQPQPPPQYNAGYIPDEQKF